jgi:hypothetical protein
MKQIIDNIAALIDLKSIITLIVVISYTVMVFMGIVQADYKDLVIMILTYYFSKKTQNK